jgi:hypothetical protein
MMETYFTESTTNEDVIELEASLFALGENLMEAELLGGDEADWPLLTASDLDSLDYTTL